MAGSSRDKTDLTKSFFSPSVANFFKGLFAISLLGAMSGGLGYVLGGLAGLYWGLGINVGISALTMTFSREIVFYMQDVKTVAQGELVEGYDLHKMVEEMMALPGFDIKKKPLIGVMSTNVINAFATGPHPGHAGVAVTRGILKQAKDYAEKTPFTAEELIKAVLLHELGHVVHYDIAIGAVTSVLASMVDKMNAQVYENHFQAKKDYNINKKDHHQDKDDKDTKKHKPILRDTVVFVLGWTIPVITKLLSLVISRAKETHADEAAFHAGYGEQMQHALMMLKGGVYKPNLYSRKQIKKLVSEFEGSSQMLFCNHHRFDDNDVKLDKKEQSWGQWAFNGVSNAFSTHPRIESRVEHLQALKAHHKP